MDKGQLNKLQDDIIERMESTPMVRSVKKPDDPDNDDYKSLVDKLKILNDIDAKNQELEIKREELMVRREEAQMQKDAAVIRAAADEHRADVEDNKSKRENAREFILTGLKVGAGYGAIILTGVLESDRLIRSKAWQWASKTISKLF